MRSFSVSPLKLLNREHVAIVYNPPRLILLYVLWALALVSLALAVTAGVHNYSPVPFGDMWPGDLLFYIAVSSGDQSHWLAQHNEHRIVLSRFLFWLDMEVLSGQTPFLQWLNYFLTFAIWALLCRLASSTLKEAAHDELLRYLPPLLLVLCFSLLQYENFYWGFQSQFFLVYLLPLGAFYCLGRFAGQGAEIGFWAACLLAILSAGAMANGVLAAPILLLLGIVLRLRRWRVAILAVLAILIPTIYFRGYVSPSGHGSLSLLWTEPGTALTYLLLYLGSPFRHLVGGYAVVAKLMGGFLLLSSLFFLWRALVQPRPFHMVLLALLLFIGATALATASGRMMFGLEQALSYRYATPALMAWAALLILYFSWLTPVVVCRPALLWLMLLIPISFLPAQLFFQSKNHFPDAFAGKAAVLSMQMGVQDQEARDRVAKNVPIWMQDFIAQELTKRSLSIFSLPELKHAAEPLGAVKSFAEAPTCLGHVDSLEPVPEDERYLRFRGWLAVPTAKAVPKSLDVADDSGRLQGRALIGGERPDVAKVIAAWARYSGFSGYVLRSAASSTLTLYGGSPACQLQLNL